MKKLYVGCSLANAPEKFVDSIKLLKKDLLDHFEILEFLGTENGTAQDVYRHDIDCVKKCDLFLAECTYPSLGLGYEIAVANALKKRVIAVAKRREKVSRLIQGIDSDNFSLSWYSNRKEVLELVIKHAIE